ncbi:MAG: hypothetical protein ACFFBF_03925 [Promethearchaeota archaeon]
MRINKIIIIYILLFMAFLTPLITIIDYSKKNIFIEETNVLEINKNHLKSSDIAGSDLYSESIDAFVAGNKSIIKQSLFTNDTNILSQFDSNDPAFYKCNVFISASNGINSEIFPRILTESGLSSHYSTSFNNFAGFLFYDKDLKSSDAKLRAERALEIIKRKFMIDLIMVNTSEPNFFPFVGACPNWDCFLSELTSNFPMDGYWKAFDFERLTSQEYVENYHISSSFMLLNSLDFFEGEYDIEIDQVNFNLESLDLSFLEGIEVENVIDQFNNTAEIYGDIFNVTISEDELEQLIESFSSFTLASDSDYATISIQYEGLSGGIQKINDNQYNFNLWNSLGYEGEPLAPSEKIYIALAGAFMSEIEINILCTDIIDATPTNYEFSEYLLEQVGLIFYLSGIDLDIEQLKNYSFDLFWVNEEGIKHSYIKPVNLENPSDIINIIQILGFQGFSFIPTGIINPIEDLSVTYNTSNSEPNLILKKEIIGGNGSYGAFRNFSYYISTKNVGNTIAWGIPTPVPLELNNFFLLLTLGNQQLADQLQDTIWEIIRIEYPNQYDSLEDFFNFDEDPRIFCFDTFGTGVYDAFYPDLLNFTNLWPYNERMDNVINKLITGYPLIIDALLILGLTPTEIKDLFMNNNSIWNDDNWKLNPGEIISYQINNYSIANLDTFSPFYRNNFTIQSTPSTPRIILGSENTGTTPAMALLNDNESWIIDSAEKFLEQRIQIEFIFKNDTKIDFINNTLENVSIIINFSAPEDLQSLNFEIFDFSKEEFRNLDPYLESIINDSWTFSIINNNDSLNWIFHSPENNDYTVLFRIKGSDSEMFNISINDLDIEFSNRDINIYEDQGSYVFFSSSTGNIQFERHSNSIPLSTYNAALLIANSSLTNFNSNPGDLNTYTIFLKNIGSNIAKNITISLLIPGIIEKTNNFTLQNSNLTYFLAELSPLQEISLNFTFYIPNSISINQISISYHNPENIEGGNTSKIVSFTNEVYILASIDYDSYIPFVRTVAINYSTHESYSTEIAPAIGDNFNLTVNLRNVSPNGFSIPDLNLLMNDQFGDLKRIDNNSIYFNDIAYNEINSFNFTLKKVGWRGYYYPPINSIKSSESRTIQISESSSMILGNINFSIIKSVNKAQIEIGDIINVVVEVENTGTISIMNIKLNDMVSYSQSEFSLVEGKLVNITDSLDPGQKDYLKYSIKGKKQGLVSLKPASIKFYYLHQKLVISNDVSLKVITPILRQYLYIALPFLISLVILIAYYWQIRNYKRKKSQYQRAEINLFELSSRESILKKEQTLRERLSILTNKYKEKSIIFETNKGFDNSDNSINKGG